MIKNPNKPIRIALVSLLSGATGLLVKTKKIPKNTTIPPKYILLINQSKRRTATAKDCFEWDCTISIDITYNNPQGYSNTDQIDDTEELVLNAVKDNFVLPGWQVMDILLIDSTDLDDETDTQSVERRILTYSFWTWPM